MKATPEQVLALTAAVEHVSRNATFPNRRPCEPDQMLPVYRQIRARPVGKPRAIVRVIECGAANGCRTDVWVWRGDKVEARINLRDADAAAQIARYELV